MTPFFTCFSFACPKPKAARCQGGHGTIKLKITIELLFTFCRSVRKRQNKTLLSQWSIFPHWVVPSGSQADQGRWGNCLIKKESWLNSCYLCACVCVCVCVYMCVTGVWRRRVGSNKTATVLSLSGESHLSQDPLVRRKSKNISVDAPLIGRPLNGGTSAKNMNMLAGLGRRPESLTVIFSGSL